MMKFPFPSGSLNTPGFPGGSVVMNSLVKPVQETQEMWVQSLGREDPWKRKWQPTPVFLPADFHGQKSLAGYSPCGHKVRHD